MRSSRRCPLALGAELVLTGPPQWPLTVHKGPLDSTLLTVLVLSEVSEMLAVPLGSMMLDDSPLRHSSQLRQYVRMEYGDEGPEWLVVEARRSLAKAKYAERSAQRGRVPRGLRRPHPQ